MLVLNCRSSLVSTPAVQFPPKAATRSTKARACLACSVPSAARAERLLCKELPDYIHQRHLGDNAALCNFSRFVSLLLG